MRTIKKRKPRARNLGFGMAAMIALIGSGCGLDSPPPSFLERPQAFIHLTIDDLGEDELLEGESDDAIDAEWQDDFLDAILGSIYEDSDLTSDDETSQSADATAGDDFTGTGAPSYQDDQIDFELRPEDLSTCAKLHGVSINRVLAAGPDKQLNLDRNKIVAARVTGNQASLYLRIDSGSPSQLRGICIFAAGNQSQAVIDLVNVSMDAVVLIARGNSPQITLRGTNSQVHELLADLAGRQAQVTIEGMPAGTCNQAIVRKRGANPQFQC